MPQNAIAQDLTGQCCVCITATGDVVNDTSCTFYLTADQCHAKSTTPPDVGEQTGDIQREYTATTCSLAACSNPSCPALPQNPQDSQRIKQSNLKFIPNISIPGASKFQQGVGTDVTQSLLPEYIQSLYKFFVGIAGILAVVMIAIGGLIWLFSGGDSGKITKAKEIIVGAIVGLILVLTSYLILNTINPKLVSFAPLGVYKFSELHVGTFCEPNERVLVDGKPTVGNTLRCGQKATVEGSNESCLGYGCPNYQNGEVCYFNPGMQEAKCLSCNTTDDDLMSLYNISQNDAGCSALTPPKEYQPIDHKQLCVFTEASHVDPNDDTCALIDVDCGNVNSCSSYDDAKIGDLYFGHGVGIDWAERSHLERICTNDINNNPSRTGICEAENPSTGQFWLNANKTCYIQNDSDCRERIVNQGEQQVVSGWTYDPGIQDQMVDASDDLKQLLNCLRPKLDEFEKQLSQPGRPLKIGRISSISDADYIGNVGACKVTPKPAKCDHSGASCHYGGDQNDGKSYGVDIGDEANGQYIEQAASECQHGYMALEGTPGQPGAHYHISTASCRIQGE